MENKDKLIRLAIKYLVGVGVGALLVMFVLLCRGFFLPPALLEQYRILADAFTTAGVVLIMVGVLIWVSTTGSFDMISFALSKLGKALIPFSKKSDEKYYDYVMRKREKRFSGYLFVFIVGALYMIPAIIFTVMFYSIY